MQDEKDRAAAERAESTRRDSAPRNRRADPQQQTTDRNRPNDD